MSEILQEVLGIVEGAGGSMSYKGLHDTLSFEQRQRLVNALKEGKKAGVLKQTVEFDNGQIIHNVVKL
jgi:hypothetical protein